MQGQTLNICAVIGLDVFHYCLQVLTCTDIFMSDPKDHELDNCRKALGECQKLLCSSEADVDASIRSKENLLKTFQELQNKHQVGKI